MKMKLRLIGDSHGKVSDSSLLKEHTIVFGDNGFKNQWEGFNRIRTEKQFILFGNHDYYPEVYSDQSLWDFSIINTGNHNILCIRGAWSVDKVHRTEGINWFKEEELTYLQGLAMLDVIELDNFDIVISHDIPVSVKTTYGYHNKTKTNNLLESVLDIVKPKEWYYGHYHNSKELKVKGTNFRCLAELEVFDLEIDKFKLKKYKL